jgi:hypothetical protein
MNMHEVSSGRLEMNIMWIIMGAMFVLDIAMIYVHSNMHKRIKFLEEQLKNKK